MHGNPISKHKQTGNNDLCTYSKVQQEHRGNEITGRYGLKGIAIETEMMRVKTEQVSLHHHTQDKEDNEAFQYLEIDGPLAICRLVL